GGDRCPFHPTGPRRRAPPSHRHFSEATPMTAGHSRTAAPAIQDMPRPAWHGVNHLALVTPDMDATVRFYHGVLGMRLVATVMAGPMRHYFFETAPGHTVAFF